MMRWAPTACVMRQMYDIPRCVDVHYMFIYTHTGVPHPEPSRINTIHPGYTVHPTPAVHSL